MLCDRIQVVKDGQLLGMIALLLVVDIMVLIVWEIVDPQHVKRSNLSEEASQNETMLFSSLHK